MSKKYNLSRVVKMPLLKFVLKFPMSGVSRYKLLRYTGVNIEGNMGFIGNNVCLDTIAPHLITIGEGAYVTEGCVVLTHHLNAKNGKSLGTNGGSLVKSK